MCELIRALEVVLLVRREILWLEKTWRQRWLCGGRSSDALHSLGRCIIAHSAYLHSSHSNNHVLAAFTGQGWIATGVLPLAFMLRLPQQAYDASQDAAMRSSFSGAALRT